MANTEAILIPDPKLLQKEPSSANCHSVSLAAIDRITKGRITFRGFNLSPNDQLDEYGFKLLYDVFAIVKIFSVDSESETSFDESLKTKSTSLISWIEYTDSSHSKKQRRYKVLK